MLSRRSQMRARASSLTAVGVALALVLGASVAAATSADAASGLIDDLGAFGRTVGLATRPSQEARPRVYRRSGIDVSHWQGRIDWVRVAAAKVDFAIIKATDGNRTVDEWYVRNRARARRVGILTTAYHFARPSLLGTGDREQRIRRDARSEARFFIRTAALRHTDLIPALDLEKSGGLRPGELRIWTMTFLHTVQSDIGARPMVYSTAAFWRTHLSDTAKVARAGYQVFWVAHWDAQSPDVPGREWLGRGWTFWQWTDCGRVSGIYDCVDRNTYTSSRSLHSLTIRRQRLSRSR